MTKLVFALAGLSLWSHCHPHMDAKGPPWTHHPHGVHRLVFWKAGPIGKEGTLQILLNHKGKEES